MMNAPEFSVEVYQNEYLTDGAREVNAIVTVASAEAGAGDGSTGRDASGAKEPLAATAEASGPTGRSRSCARSRRRYSVASISFLTRWAWLPISRP
jgi:hypothetical protein